MMIVIVPCAPQCKSECAVERAQTKQALMTVLQCMTKLMLKRYKRIISLALSLCVYVPSICGVVYY